MLSDPAIYEYENAPPASMEWLRARYEKLETRRSADGSEQWLNWVIRMTGAGLIGYVQATLHADGSAAIAYEMSSAWWGRGLGRRATEAMLRELVHHYGVTTIFAVAKATQSSIPWPAREPRLHACGLRAPRAARSRARRSADGPRSRAAIMS